tara:strand:- start:4631 stop:4948 length:318 start_codon:yes stop_codon:yes gene_type:complete
MKITRKQIRDLIREQIDKEQTIRGSKVNYALKADIQAKVSDLKKRLAGKYYADTHEIWSSKPGESPEETVERFQQWSGGSFPGGVTIYQDPDTGEVFGHAKYNTF